MMSLRCTCDDQHSHLKIVSAALRALLDFYSTLPKHNSFSLKSDLFWVKELVVMVKKKKSPSWASFATLSQTPSHRTDIIDGNLPLPSSLSCVLISHESIIFDIASFFFCILNFLLITSLIAKSLATATHKKPWIFEWDLFFSRIRR